MIEEEAMLHLNLNFWQLLLVIGIYSLVYVLMSNLTRILIKIIFSSAPVVAWNLKRQTEVQKVTKLSKRQEMHNKLVDLGEFVEWIDKSIGNTINKTHFWKDFSRSKTTRDYWIKTLTEQFAPEPKINKSEPIENKQVKENKA